MGPACFLLLAHIMDWGCRPTSYHFGGPLEVPLWSLPSVWTSVSTPWVSPRLCCLVTAGPSSLSEVGPLGSLFWLGSYCSLTLGCVVVSAFGPVPMASLCLTPSASLRALMLTRAFSPCLLSVLRLWVSCCPLGLACSLFSGVVLDGLLFGVFLGLGMS